MADTKQKWIDATRSILLALDLPTEYALLGLQIPNPKPNAKGWVACRSADVDTDRSPSAGFCVADSPMLGRYKDFRSGRTCTFFDFAARQRGAGEWKQARNHYARQTGIKLPDGEEELVADRFDLFDLTFGVMSIYAAGKPGITVRAIQEVGCRGARWPKKLSAERTNHLIVAPMHGSALLDLEPTGWHCVAANPKSKIRKFQGQGNQDELLKSMTAGDYGLMNVDGLNRLADAGVIWIVEGLTDLLAGQAVLGPWRDEDPAGRRHVMLSAGGCSYHPRAEWMQHFAGKRVNVCFDVGDADDAGGIGAAVWVSALLSVAGEVRNVKLPVGKDGGKNDLRAWLVDGHGYADLLAVAETFEPVEAGDTVEAMEPHEAILKSLGLTVIGEYEGSQKIQVFSDSAKKSHAIVDIDRLTIAKLVQLVGYGPVDQFVYDGQTPQAGKFKMPEVRNAIAAAASDKVFHAEEFYGAGVWRAAGKLVVVKAGEIGVLDERCAHVERSVVPYINGCVLDISRATGDWVDLGLLNRHLAEAQRREWCYEVYSELTSILGKWYWRRKTGAQVTAMLTICSWVQSLWQWRPMVFLSGATDTGKSMLISDVLAPLFGKLVLSVNKTTEAAIRQHMKHHAKILFIDEMEHDQHRQKIFDLFRTSSRGGESIRGTSDQRGAKYRVQHIPWFAAIENGLKKQADKNRFILLDLAKVPGDVRGNIDLPANEQLANLGPKLLAVALANFHAAERLAKHLRGKVIAGVPGRVVESFSVPMGMWGSIMGFDEQAATGAMIKILADWDFTDQASQDDEDLLQEILTTEVVSAGGKRQNVSQLLSEVGPDSIGTLERIGIRKIERRKTGEEVMWVCPKVVSRNLLRIGSDFSNQAIEQYLMRLDGASRSRQRLGGHEQFTGIDIPLKTIDALFCSNGEYGRANAQLKDQTELEF